MNDVIIYGLHSTFVKEMIKTWASNISAIPHDFFSAGYVPSLMFGIYFREESKNMEQQGKAKGLQISQDQILGEGPYADPQV